MNSGIKPVILAFAVLVTPWPTAASHAKTYCAKDWICVESVEFQDHVDIYVESYKSFPVTATVRAVRLRNLRPDGRDTVTRTLKGAGREHVMRLDRVSLKRNTRYDLAYNWTVGDIAPKHDDGYLYRLPYAKGKRFWVIQGYGSRFSHTGSEEYTVDFDMPVGTHIFAARDGIVARKIEKHSKGCWDSGCGKYANYLIIMHSDGTTGEYYHLDRQGVLVEPGEHVERGQLIAYSGNTGHTTMPHLHFGVYRARSWGRTQSIPVRFQTRTGVVKKVRAGRVYEVELYKSLFSHFSLG